MAESMVMIALGLVGIVYRKYLGRLQYEAVGRKEHKVEHYQLVALLGGCIASDRARRDQPRRQIIGGVGGKDVSDAGLRFGHHPREEGDPPPRPLC